MGVTEVVAIAASIVAALCVVIAKLYRDLQSERIARTAAEQLLNREHKRDLRRVGGLPTSLDPPALPPESLPLIIHDDTPPTRRTPRNPPPRKR